MKKFRTWIAYGIYVLLVATLFIYLLFPADKVKAHITARVGQMYPNIRMSIGDASPSGYSNSILVFGSVMNTTVTP